MDKHKDTDTGTDRQEMVRASILIRINNTDN